MGKARNFFLMLKQGIKGVFKFKAQFIIIIILAFVATFILSVSLSTQLRMQDSYNKIVKPVKKFSYSGNIQVDSDANANSDPFILANELDNSGSTDLKIVVTKDGTDKVVRELPSFNFVLYNQGGYYKDGNDVIDTFLTRGTQNYVEDNESNNADTFVGSDKGSKALYRYWLVSLFEDLKNVSDGKPDEVGQTAYSPIALYTRENPNWFADFVKFKDDGTVDTSYNEGKFVNGFNFTDDAIAHKDVFTNAVIGVAQLAAWTNSVVDNYDKSVKSDDSEKLTVKDAIGFLFGKTDKKEWELTGDTAYWLNPTLNIDNDRNDKDDLANRFAMSSDTKKNINNAIYESGLRGITNPFINENNDSSSFSTDLISGWDYFAPMSISSVKGDDNKLRNMYEAMTAYGDYYGTEKQYSLTSNAVDDIAVQNIEAGRASNASSVEAMFYTHNIIAASAAGFDYKLRREVTFFDAKTQLKFRAIALNKNEDYNFTILRGRTPSDGEVAISEQFAKKNKLKVGSMLTVGDAFYMISGIATDALSYMPAQDLADPIPNPKVSSFIYATVPTINMMNTGTKTSNASKDAVTENLSYLLFDKENNAATVASRENTYEALFSNDRDAAISNYNVAKAYFGNNNKDNLAGSSHLSLDEFKKSGYRYSWTLQPLVFKLYDSITYTVAGIIALIAMIALIVCVKKTIDFNSKQIGILKALGEKPGGISVSYLSYSLIIMFIVVPVAWIIGIVLQIPFGNMFLTYFSVQPDVILWDWISFVIAFGVLGVLSAAVSYLSAWMLTNKPVLEVLTSSIKWGRLRLLDFIKNHSFKHARFSTRFSLTLTSSGSKQIVLMTVVMLVASFLMSAALAIPSIVVKVNSTYYKSIAYANKYDEVPMTGNAPLSKNSISYWNGQDYLAKDFVPGKLELDNSSARYGYYKDPEAYTSTVSNSNAISQYLYDAKKNAVSDGQLYVLQHQQDLMNVVGSMFGDNFFTHLGVSFSIGEIDKLYGVLLHSYDTIFDPSIKDYTDNVKLSEAQGLSTWLTTAIPQIIGTIVNSNASDSNGSSDNSDANVKDTTWKQKVMNVIYSAVPSYVKAYIKESDSRLDQYAIAFQNEIYIPGQETLTTNVDNSNSVINGKTQEMSLTGLDQYQNSINIKKVLKDKAYLPDEVKEKLYNLINVPVTTKDGGKFIDQNSDIIYKGVKYYDASSHTITLPVIPNQQAASAYDMDDGKTMSWANNVRSIEFNANGTYYDLPKTAWVYNDTDWADYLTQTSQQNAIVSQFNKQVPNAKNLYDSNNPNKDWIYDKIGDKYYFNPNRIDNNKLTFTQEFNNAVVKGTGENSDALIIGNNADGTDGDVKGINLKDRAQMFKDFEYDENDNPIGTFIRPYYQYKNMQLIVPSGWINEDTFLKLEDNVKTKQWYHHISYADVPDSVKDGYFRLTRNNNLDWKKATDNDWLVINPYDTNYFQDNYQPKTSLGNLIDGPSYWYKYILYNTDGPLIMDTAESGAKAFSNQGANDLKIKLRSVGTIDSYNDKLVVIDSDLANALSLYPLNRHYEYNYQTFDRSVEIKPGETTGFDNNSVAASQFSRYKFKLYSDTDSQNKFVKHNWNNDKNAMNSDLWNLSYDKYKSAITGGIMNYAPHAFYNGKLSNIDEALNYTSQISFTKAQRWGQSAINLGDSVGGGTPSIIQSSTLLSTTKQLIKQIAVLAVAIGAMLMIAIIITAALVTMLTGDIYIAQYQRFMVLLRALGYSKTQVFSYTFGTVTILALIAWALGTIIAWLIIFVGVQVMWNAGFAIPVGINWWPILLSLVVMFASYFGSLWVSSSKARRSNPSTILTATAE